MDYQKIVFVGNITKDAERKTSKDESVNFTTFSVAVSEGKDRTTYFPITIFGQLGETLAQYLTKGRQTLVEGRISVNKNGRFNVIADRVVLGGGQRNVDETDDKSLDIGEQIAE